MCTRIDARFSLSSLNAFERRNKISFDFVTFSEQDRNSNDGGGGGGGRGRQQQRRRLEKRQFVRANFPGVIFESDENWRQFTIVCESHTYPPTFAAAAATAADGNFCHPCHWLVRTPKQKVFTCPTPRCYHTCDRSDRMANHVKSCTV